MKSKQIWKLLAVNPQLFWKSKGREIQLLKDENHNLKQKMINLEAHSRRNNLIFLGIKEQQRESVEERILKLLKDAKVDLPSRAVERAHRVGRYDPSRTRPCIVKFHHHKDRELALYAGKAIFETAQVRVNEDFPREIIQNRKTMLPIFYAAKTNYSQTETTVSLNADVLLIGKGRYTGYNLTMLPPIFQPVISTRTDGSTLALLSE